MRAADADILILPGLSGGSAEHWYSRWEARLSTARRVEQIEWMKPQRSAWVETIKREITRCKRPVICVAHSLGVVALLHAAETESGRIAGAFMAAPPSESVTMEIAEIDKAFLPFPRRPLGFPAILVASENDPYAEIGFSRELAKDLGAEFINAGQAGHLNPDSGYGPWPEGSIRFAAFVSSL